MKLEKPTEVTTVMNERELKGEAEKERMVSRGEGVFLVRNDSF